jgi:hypothetical protein
MISTWHLDKSPSIIDNIGYEEQQKGDRQTSTQTELEAMMTLLPFAKPAIAFILYRRKRFYHNLYNSELTAFTLCHKPDEKFQAIL